MKKQNPLPKNLPGAVYNSRNHIRMAVCTFYREVLLESLSRVVYVLIVVVGYGKEISIYEETMREKRRKLIERILRNTTR